MIAPDRLLSHRDFLLAGVGVLVFCLTGGPARAQVYELMEKLSQPSGLNPSGGLVEGSDGFLYGTTSGGGGFGKGTVYRIAKQGEFQTVAHFSGVDGSNPQAALIQTPDGNFYGTTRNGGDADLGTVFQLTPEGVLTRLFSFTALNTGIFPMTKLIRGDDGMLYGSTSQPFYQPNIQGSGGTIFRLSPEGEFTKLWGNLQGGASPAGNLFQGNDGNFYGERGGVPFRMTPGGAIADISISSTIGTGANGAYVTGDSGWLYDVFGSAPGGFGSVYRMTLSGSASQVALFPGPSGKGPNYLMKGDDGDFYGTTTTGGDFNRGTIFRVSPDGTITVLHHFAAATSSPRPGLIQASDGNFYGTLGSTGESGTSGGIFRMTPAGDTTILLSFNGANENYRRMNLMQTAEGTLYGTRSGGGAQQKGDAFRMSPGGTPTTLASFDGTARGGDPGAMILAGDGNLYGTTYDGGSEGKGTVFRLSPSGAITTLIHFDGSNGAHPEAGLVEGVDGSLYGTTSVGGAHDLGTIFKVSTTGLLTTLHHFSGTDGYHPQHRLVFGGNGDLYGTTPGGGTNDMGTVFRITTTGTLLTLLSFSGTDGAEPNGLVRYPDGKFYGTTRSGGTNSQGTIFSMAENGALTTLVHFTGPNGSQPGSALTLAPNGRLYGSTARGGTNDGGTVFQIEGDGTLTTLLHCGDVLADRPSGEVFLAQDGNLYGTTLNSVFRLIFPGSPVVDPGVITNLSTTSVGIDASINPRGSTTQSVIEYGTDGLAFPFSASTSPFSLSGFATRSAGATLTGLSSGTRYYYRVRSVNTHGVSISTVGTFATLAQPAATTLPATDLGPNTATLNGLVDARENVASVVFEYGTDGNTFPVSIVATPPSVSGNSDTPVSATIAGLTKGVTYHFRLRATNAAGTTVSGSRSFSTLIEPLATTGAAFALTTTSARVTGTVNARGADTQVFVEFGTNGATFPNLIAANPGLATGDGATPVSAILPNLTQGTTYHYRIRANSAGGLTHSSPATFRLEVLSGLTRVFPGAPPDAQGFVSVTLAPQGLLHGWRFVGEILWRPSGTVVGGLTTAPGRRIEFRPVPGHITPPERDVEIQSGGVLTEIAETYFETGNSGSGGLSVVLKPDSITTGAERAQWRVMGESDVDWRDSGATISALVPGNYLVESKPVPGRAVPPVASVTVSDGQTTTGTITYFPATQSSGESPTVLAFETVTSDSPNPYAYVGQFRSRSGSGSGFVVKTRVVATAAHVVWDEGTLAPVDGLQWFFQRHAGIHEGDPLRPRGFYLADGYASLRQSEGTPGTFSPQSRNRDVAAVYFQIVPAGRGGHGGFLASDLDDNEFLLSDANKMLVAYPVEGIPAASQGRMHATAPANLTFAPVGPSANRTFLSSDLRGSGGASGGALCVQFDGGTYYPAAIYLGAGDEAVVRAIDSEVIDLFNRAETTSISGQGQTTGGITHTDYLAIGTAFDPGALEVAIEPAAARTAGAGWRLRPESSYRESGSRRNGLNAGRYTLELAQLDGFQLPAPQFILIKGGQLKTLIFTYALPPAPAAAITLRGNDRVISNGDTSPSLLDGSDFGVVAVDGGTATRTFSISNPGTSELSVGSLVVDGMNEDDFSISIPPGSSIPPGGSTTFTILFDPSAPGTRSATVSFATNVTGSNPFTFSIQGNDSTDSDSDGFTDVEEASLADLLAGFTVGQTIDLDLSFLRLGSGQILALLNLPPGLTFDPDTKRITGTITGKAATPQVEIRKVDGADIVSSITTDFPVFTPARLTVSGARPFPATRLGRRSRPQTLSVTNAGELALNGVTVRTSGKAARDYLVTQPAVTTLDAGATTNFTVTFKPKAKGSRRAGITIFSNTPPKTVPVSGRGK